MALLRPKDVKTLDYIFNGMPFVDVQSKDGLRLGSIDYIFNGMPFNPNPDDKNPGKIFIFKQAVNRAGTY